MLPFTRVYISCRRERRRASVRAWARCCSTAGRPGVEEKGDQEGESKKEVEREGHRKAPGEVWSTEIRAFPPHRGE